MEKKYKSVGLDYNLIISKYPNIQEYEEIVNTFLSDPFFKELGDYINDEDYELARDACKGLYVLSEQLCLYPLYMSLLEVYEDIEEEIYKDVRGHYDEMYKVYEKIKGAFYA